MNNRNLINIKVRSLVLTILCSILLLNSISIPALAQGKDVTLQGNVVNDKNIPIRHADIYAPLLRRHYTTDSMGHFYMNHLPYGKEITLELLAIGYHPSRTVVKLNQRQQIQFFVLKDKNAITDTVSVRGYTPLHAINRQAYNVTAVDASQIHNTTLDIAHVLDRLPGARLRESGGVGSDYDFSISGFSGKRIKFFLDGLPMDNFGSAFQINNIPVNIAERIEVYKGVVPIWLGSDALGGAVNIITDNKLKNYLDVSYSYGSFNTHRSYINMGHTFKNGFTVRVNAFQNYSDNNYKVNVAVADLHTGKYTADTSVRRFHDRYHNESVITQVGFIGKKWADQFLLGLTLGKDYKEIQTGARLVTVYGAWHTTGNLLMPTVKYLKKNFFLDGLNFSLNANYNFGQEQNIDTVNARYGWLGDSIKYRGRGGESTNPTNFKYRNNTANVVATFTYSIGTQHLFALNSAFSHFNRKGQDYFSPNSLNERIPQKTNKNILGLSYQYRPSQQWNITLLTKYLYQRANTTLTETSIFSPDDTTYTPVHTSRQKLGYGMATAYFIRPELQVKFSYEKAYRMPEAEDIFGDLINKSSNWNIQPEYSDNFNLGFNCWMKLNDVHHLYLNANALYYHAQNYIAYTFNPTQTKTIASNYYSASNVGLELEARYSYQKSFNSGFNITYQNIRDKQKQLKDSYTGSETVNNSYNERIPNIPYLFGNADVSYLFKNCFVQNDRLQIMYNLSYMHSFYLYAVNQGDPSTKLGVPKQWSHDLFTSYTLKNGRYNIGLECKNFTNARLYDNFSLQKPGRAIYVKLRYFIRQ